MSDKLPPGPPTPGAEHKLLKPFEGTFRAKVSLWMGPGDPVIHHGVMVSAFQVGGLFLHQDYVGDAAPGPWPAFLGKGYWGFNSTTKLYEGFWIDNASTMMQLETGTVDTCGKVWTMQSTFVHPHIGQQVTKKSIIRLIDNDHHEMTTFIIGPDGKETRTMQIDYVRS